jgi:hypothetical protein
MFLHADWPALNGAAWASIVGAVIVGWLPIVSAMGRLRGTPWICRVVIGGYLLACGLFGTLFLIDGIAPGKINRQPFVAFPAMVGEFLMWAIIWPIPVGWGLLGMA